MKNKAKSKIKPRSKPKATPAVSAPTARQLGALQRKVLPRVDLALWNPKARQQTPADLLAESVRGRVPSLVKIKNERMAASPFVFFRGAVPVMAYDLSLHPNTGIVSQLCGDAHVQNFGAFTGLDGRLLFDINDFDETLRGPFEWDVKRMATSILLAGDAARIKTAGCANATQSFLAAYCGMMQRFSRMPVLAIARYLVHRVATVRPVTEILHKAEHATPLRLLDKLTVETDKGRIFKSDPPLLHPVSGHEAKSVLAGLPEYIQSLLPERRHFFAQFRPIAVGFKVVGTGSVGLRDYCVLMEGNNATDPMFLQIKQEAPSAYLPYLPQSTPLPANDGQRTAEGQRAMQLASDPLLGWTTLDGRSYLVRQLNDHKAAVDITTLKATGLQAYAEVCGELLARGHARSGDARMIAGYIGNGTRFKQGILGFARAYAAQTVDDWKAHVAKQ